MVRAYVESLLERLIGQTQVTPDADGDYPVRYQGCLYYVRIVGEGSPVVQVFSVAVRDIKATAPLLKELNALNSQIKFARIFWVKDQVLVESEMLGEGIEPVDFANACRAVFTITDHIGPVLAKKFGGTTAFADEQTDEAKAEPPADQAIGQYL